MSEALKTLQEKIGSSPDGAFLRAACAREWYVSLYTRELKL